MIKTSTLTYGNMSLRFGAAETVLQNRKNFLNENNISWEDHVCMRCNHGATIIAINHDTAVDAYRMTDAEVLITQEKNLALMLLTADCLPTTLYDPVTQTLALAHFSRQTIAESLPTQTITHLKQHFDCNPENILVTVGPYIHTNSYRFPAPLKTVSRAIQPHLIIENDYTCIDLLSAHNTQLIEAGIKKEHIAMSSIDTATSPEHFSHYMSTRHNHSEGRIATIATMAS